MNKTRNFAQILIKCSRFSSRSLSTCTGLLRNSVLNSSAATNYLSRPCTAQLKRSMCSTSKFEVINVQDEEDFKKIVLDASVPVVVDFHATWCAPCKILGPRLESILSKEEGKILMAKVDIDDNPDLAMEYGVRSVPTVVGMKNGKVLNQFIGVKDNDQIATFVDKLVVS